MRIDTTVGCLRALAAVLPPIALAVAACGGGGDAADLRSARTVREIMVSVVDPAADAIWDAVEIVATYDGTVEKRPQTAEEWEVLRGHALTLTEASRMLRVAGLRVARPGEPAGDPRVDLHPDEIEARIAEAPLVWTSHARGLQGAAAVTLQAVEARSVTALVEAGEALDQACEACHQAYWYRPLPEPVTDRPPRRD